jgi:hypothetical protein
MLDEERMPSEFRHHANRQTVCLVGTAVQVLGKKFAPLRIGDHGLIKSLEGGGRHRFVIIPPRMGIARGPAGPA